MRKVLTIKEAAAATGLAEWELRQGAKAGKYPAMRAGGPNGKFLFDLELLNQAITRLMLENTRGNDEALKEGVLRPVRLAK
jgi:hypothetical protein